MASTLLAYRREIYRQALKNMHKSAKEKTAQDQLCLAQAQQKRLRRQAKRVEVSERVPNWRTKYNPKTYRYERKQLAISWQFTAGLEN